MTIIVGLTGGMASGKTTTVEFLKKKGFFVHDSDLVVKKLYSKPTSDFLKYLKKIKISKAIKKTSIDKSVVRESIFNNKAKKRKLELFIHEWVRIEREKFIKKHKIKKTKILILDIPLLFEAKLTHICDYIILLHTTKKTKIQRALQRKGMTKNLVLKILKQQLSDAYKKKKADFIINTSNPKKKSFKMILQYINCIVKKNA